MEYACSVWAPYTAKDIGALESVQNFACRMATHNWTISSYQELLSLTNLPILERRRIELQLSHLFKIVHNLCYFPEGLVTVRECSHYNTCTTHSLTLHQPFAHTNNYLNSFLPRILFPSGINSQKILFLVPHLIHLSLTNVSINNFDHLVLFFLCVFRHLFKCIKYNCLYYNVYIPSYMFSVLIIIYLIFTYVLLLISGFTVLLAPIFAKCVTRCTIMQEI